MIGTTRNSYQFQLDVDNNNVTINGINYPIDFTIKQVILFHFGDIAETNEEIETIYNLVKFIGDQDGSGGFDNENGEFILSGILTDIGIIIYNLPIEDDIIDGITYYNI